MGDDFLIDTDKVRATAKAIKSDTDNLRTKTATYLSQIDATSKLLPSVAYEASWAAIVDLKAFLNRSMDERDRINTILGEVATQVDKLDKQVAKVFNDATNNPPKQK